MGVYIKGMAMPKSCFACKLLDYTDTFKCRFRFESLAREHGINISRPDWCPLVPVPEHGRLIDADALMKKGMPLSFSVQKWVQEVDIACAPTIIPADKEGEE